MANYGAGIFNYIAYFIGLALTAQRFRSCI